MSRGTKEQKNKEKKTRNKKMKAFAIIDTEESLFQRFAAKVKTAVHIAETFAKSRFFILVQQENFETNVYLFTRPQH